jgi:hypothetical protein
MLTIEHPITGEKLQIANMDFLDKMSWPKAKAECRALGNGWRLPSMEELESIFNALHKNGMGNFKMDIYWSNSAFYTNQAHGFDFDFKCILPGSGGRQVPHISEEHFARAVRSL